VNPWQILDVLIVGWNPVSIDSAFPIDQTKRRLLDLNSDMPNAALPLTASVNDDSVEVGYLAEPGSAGVRAPGYSGIVYFIRPVFRGRLISDGGVRLVGAFGGGWIVRLVGLTAIAIAILMTLDGVDPSIGNIGLRLWAVPLIFIAACFVTRINGADDIRLVVNNLIYALRGDDGSA